MGSNKVPPSPPNSPRPRNFVNDPRLYPAHFAPIFCRLFSAITFFHVPRFATITNTFVKFDAIAEYFASIGLVLLFILLMQI